MLASINFRGMLWQVIASHTSYTSVFLKSAIEILHMIHLIIKSSWPQHHGTNLVYNCLPLSIESYIKFAWKEKEEKKKGIGKAHLQKEGKKKERKPTQ